MKNLRITSLIFSALIFLSSCAVSLRDDTGTASTASTEKATETELAVETTDDVSENNTTETAETSAETTVETTAEETTVATEESTEEPVTPDEPPTEAAFKPKALMYHLILEEVYGPYEKLFVRPTEFELHLSILDELGYEYLFADEWRLTEGPSVIITLDDGYEDNYTEMFPILKSYGAKATVFLVTDLIGTDGYMTREMIREMSDSGLVSFQCHTAHHSDLSYMSEASLRADFDESCGIIEEITGKPVAALAYPAGSYNETVLSIADEYFNFAYTTKAPYTTTEYTDLTVPRYYIARGYGRDTFLSFVRY